MFDEHELSVNAWLDGIIDEVGVSSGHSVYTTLKLDSSSSDGKPDVVE